MTDKDKIRAEIERHYNYHKDHADDYAGTEHFWKADEDRELLSFIDSMQEEEIEEIPPKFTLISSKEEPVSEDLEKVSEAYALDDYIKPWKELVKRAFKDGTKWQKEQMIAKAIDAKLLEGHLIRQKSVTHPLHVGDKVKVIIIKED